MTGPSPRLTTHVLDLTGGQPARGLAVALTRLDGPGAGPLVRVETNAEGRTDQPLLSGPDLAAGRYELAYSVGAWFADRSTGNVPAIPYLDVVPIHFGVDAGTGHLHVALLITPYSYTTYRGS
jgi:hydroxyisourate hydrolase